jgi:hypothetical protein
MALGPGQNQLVPTLDRAYYRGRCGISFDGMDLEAPSAVSAEK